METRPYECRRCRYWRLWRPHRLQLQQPAGFHEIGDYLGAVVPDDHQVLDVESVDAGPADPGFDCKYHVGSERGVVHGGQHGHLVDVAAQAMSGEGQVELDVRVFLETHVFGPHGDDGVKLALVHLATQTVQAAQYPLRRFSGFHLFAGAG